MTNTPAICELKSVSKQFIQPSGNVFSILDSIDLSIHENELVAILGPSGCGKSTLLRLICGLIPASKGDVIYRGQRLVGVSPGVALVFQNFGLYPWLTVYENIDIPLSAKGLVSVSERKEKIQEVISKVDLTGFEDAYPKELSGGMKQRVGIARALAVEPDLLCMDEPFSGLDVLTAENLRQEIVQLWLKKQTKTVLIVTHNIAEAIFLATRIVVLSSNPGQIREVVENKLPYPRNPRSVEFAQLEDRIHELITHVLIPDDAAQEPTPSTLKRPLRLQPLPKVDAVETVELLEAIAARGGEVDLFDFAEEADKEFGQVVLITKAAEMLNWVETPKHQIVLTLAGKAIVNSDHEARKQLLQQHLRELPIFQLVLRLLENAPEHEVEADIIEEEFAIRLPNENPVELFEMMVNWGRYADLLDYDNRSSKLSLEIHKRN